MKALFPIVGLLIRVIIGDTNIQNEHNPLKAEIRIKKRYISDCDRPSISLLPMRNEIYDNHENRGFFQENKSPGFNRWTGKRVDSSTNYRPAIRVPFNSWGGKRNGITGLDTKRGRFLVNWNGKKVVIDNLEEKRMAESYKNDRRVPFNSWGGKRSDLDTNSRELHLDNGWTEQMKENSNIMRNDTDLDQQIGSSNFVSWRVKRSQKQNEKSDRNTAPDRKFHSWAG